MAIKKRPVSPRQKMINLMYVILMAMLALNTPTDEEFGVKGKSIVEKIKKSLADDGKKSDEEKKNIDLVELNVNELDAFVIPEKTTLYAGERFNSHVVMAAIDSTQRPEIYVNGSRLNAENGRYSFVAGGVGEHQFGGYILMRGKNGEMMRRNFVHRLAVSTEFLMSRYAILLVSYSLISCGVNLAISASSKRRSKPKSVSKLMYLSSTCFIRFMFLP